MALKVAFLDTGPLGLVTQKPGKSMIADACATWADNLVGSGILVIVPEIADYELRRELLRANNTAGVDRLDRFIAQVPGRFWPINTVALREAARLWAAARNAGQPTAPPQALDGDVILAAQTTTFCMSYRLELQETIVATVNVRHITRFVPSDIWQNIRADDED